MSGAKIFRRGIRPKSGVMFLELRLLHTLEHRSFMIFDFSFTPTLLRCTITKDSMDFRKFFCIFRPFTIFGHFGTIFSRFSVDRRLLLRLHRPSSPQSADPPLQLALRLPGPSPWPSIRICRFRRITSAAECGQAEQRGGILRGLLDAGPDAPGPDLVQLPADPCHEQGPGEPGGHGQGQGAWPATTETLQKCITKTILWVADTNFPKTPTKFCAINEKGSGFRRGHRA